jgi:predicted AlkP superfamily pyrophosphatase or phosphodiesterase
MKLVVRIGLLVIVGLTPSCNGPASDASSDKPTLVILMVVDQLRADLLDRYDPLFVGGFRRLRDEGYRFTNATHDHAMTATAPGHTTLSTGVYPSRHGIVGNSWLELDGSEWRSVYSMEDLDRTILGHPELPGRSSSNIDRGGLPDWIVANDPGSRVVSISRKDRSAIGLAAKSRGEVYWLLPDQGHFVTSDFYHSEYPEWVADFNATTMPLVYADSVWESTIPPEARSLTRPDTSIFESDGEDTAFPHRAQERMGSSDPRALNRWRSVLTPFPDRAVVSLALEAIQELGLGQRGSLDYLGISLSQTDLVGHSYGPLSREQLDNLLRLDAELERLFSFLDHAVGAGRWVVALSADHGVLDIPEQLAEEGVDAGRLTLDDLRGLRAYVAGAIEVSGEDEDPEEVAKAALMTRELVSAVYTFSEVESDVPADTFQALFANSHSRTRRVGPVAWAGVHVRLEPNVLIGNERASHGSPYYHDRHVPMVFLGGSVQAGTSDERVATVDVAPTLAWLVGTGAPNDLDGRVLEGVARH